MAKTYYFRGQLFILWENDTRGRRDGKGIKVLREKDFE